MGFLFALLVGAVAAAQEIHTPFCLYGCPSGAPVTNDLVVRSIYALSSNDETKFADWVAYRVTKDTIGPTRQRVWKSDPALAPDETLEPDDYNGANGALGVDRGHQAPLASFTNTAEWEATNYLSNITPQKSELNQGPWERLESAERSLTRRNDVSAVYVLTGPLYQRAMSPLPGTKKSHRVPSGYWKIVAIENPGGLKVAGFILDQETARDASFCDFAVNIDKIEAAAHLNVFPDLSASTHAALASVAAPLKADLGCNGG